MIKFLSPPTFKVLTASLFFLSFLLVFAGCKKDPNPPSATPAKGKLVVDEYGGCASGQVIHGTWYDGFPAATDTTYVEVNVHVTSPGSFNITTYRKNGVMFSAVGNFADTGLKTVRLYATGSFLLPGSFDYPVTFDSSSCPFTVGVLDSAGISMAPGTFQFTVGGHTYRGNASGPLYQLPQNAGYSFEFNGTMASGSPDTVLQMGFVTDVVDTLSHLTSQGATSGLGFYGPEGKRIYGADNGTVPAVVDIRFRSFTGGFVTGTFNGTVRDSANNIVPITNAKFKL